MKLEYLPSSQRDADVLFCTSFSDSDPDATCYEYPNIPIDACGVVQELNNIIHLIAIQSGTSYCELFR